MMMHEITKRATAIEKRYGKLLSLNAVAEYLGLDLSTVEALVAIGEIDSVAVAGICMVKSVHLAKFELDVTGMPMGTPSPVMEEREVDIMKVTEGSIYPVKSSKNPYEMRFFITFDDGVRRAVKIRGTSEEEVAQKKQQKILEVLAEYRAEKNGAAEVQQPVVVEEPKTVTFRTVSEMWYKEFKRDNESRGNSYANIESAKYSLKTINKVIGEKDIRDITKEVAQEMINEISLDNGENFRSKSHVEKAMRKFKNVMDYAFENGYIDRQIGKLVLNKNLREADKDSRFIEKETLIVLLDCIKGNMFYHTLVNLILSSGLRQEEALALTIDDIVVNNGLYQIYVSKVVVELSSNNYGIIDRLKHGERARYISIPKEIYDMVRDYYRGSMEDACLVEMRKEHDTEKYIFVNKNGCIHNKRTLYHSMVGYLERNMPQNSRIRLHMLRHTFASLMKNEVPLEVVSEVLGHSDISITMRFYASQTIEDHKRVSLGAEAMMKKIKG